MAELFIELFGEEIPARMQGRASADLNKRICDGLKDAGLSHGPARCFATPRRLALVVPDLETAQPDIVEDRRGPRVGAPDKAIDGFLKANGLTRDALEQRETPKGAFYFVHIEQKGRATSAVLQELVPAVVDGFPWPKSMRWGAGRLRWVRPLHKLVCLFDGAVVDCAIPDGPKAGNTTEGHRFLSPSDLTITSFEDYEAKLRSAHVVLGTDERKQIIANGARELAQADGYVFEPDPGLLTEVAGLVEWPVVLSGTIDNAFMDVPKEVLMTSMQGHQKYFPLFDGAGELAPKFILVSNICAPDGGAAIVAGNERVLRARLHDAKFFWDQDRKQPLSARLPRLESIVFHARLGSLAQKVVRIERLAWEIGQHLGVDTETHGHIARAAELCKADLVTDMVYEFPELQGLMGRYYARHDGEADPVSEAIADHYAPAGPADECPTALVSVIVSMADKIDSLVGFFGIEETPTGSKDPFALRRAALGVIRLVLENNLRISLSPIFEAAHALYGTHLSKPPQDNAVTVMAFLADRLKVYLRESGLRHDLISAVFAVAGESDVTRLTRRAEALRELLEGEDGTNLLAGYRRAANIVRAETGKNGWVDDGAGVDGRVLEAPEERRLFETLSGIETVRHQDLEEEPFRAFLLDLSGLREPVDAFFEAVKVNVQDETTRDNRLKLLKNMTSFMNTIADFSEIEG